MSWTGRAAMLGTALALLTPAALRAQGIPLDSARPEPAHATGPLWALDAFSASGYDSNIDGDPDGEALVSGAVGLRGLFRSDADDPLLEVSYEIALNRATPQPRWNRVSHAMYAELKPHLHGAWRLRTLAEVSLLGSSEDHDLSNRYAIRQRVEYRFARWLALRAEGELRKQYDVEDPESDALNRSLRLSTVTRMGHGRRLTLMARQEFNHAVTDENHYTRRGYTAELETIAFGSDTVVAGFEAQWKRFPNRLVELDDGDVERVDRRLKPALTWLHPLGDDIWVGIGYELEERTSNKPGKRYVAHSVLLTLTRRW
ncbi:MAG TPA: hypothetical protein VFK13_05230 [Gemmatimonadaceae bacterium]|nr:hypothetical protein [Gemmatimonadaceae bacterium]